MNTRYRPERIEAEVQASWEAADVFRVREDPGREKFYCLSMFPYPSGRIHMGHVRNYTIGDVISRYQRMLGKNVLQPMGWDAFGLPAENAAIENGIPPARWTRENIAAMRKQLKGLGFAYDWSRELATCDPEYYRWEQWFFTVLYEKGLVYRKSALVNWDPVDRTVLANEQVIDGRGWRSGAPVERREVPQWFLRITRYAEELLSALERAPLKDGWPEVVRNMQKNWLGRSEGVEVEFPAAGAEGMPLKVFTTRPDTLMGVTYLAVAPEHPLTQAVARENQAVAAFAREAGKGAISEAVLETMEKEGLPLGVEAVHPVSGERLPVWVANFVLMSYGAGAVMGVPAHDRRDWEFARKFGLPIRQVVFPADGGGAEVSEGAFLEPGVLVNSGCFDGLSSAQAFDAVAERLRRQGRGSRKTHYRLRDWGISRQRYWGCPIPILYDRQGRARPVPEQDLPVLLPEGVTPQGRGSPLGELPEFREAPLAEGETGSREIDTFDTFVESSWYYARYCCPDRDGAMLDERAHYWLPVDQYVGGIEHAVLHLLYARFFHKLLRDEGLVRCDEPFRNLLTQGMVLKGGVKMSKSRGNTVDPQELVDRYGADTVRLYIMFAAPPEQNLEWSDRGIAGAFRFLNRLWDITARHVNSGGPAAALTPTDMTSAERQFRRLIHSTIAKAEDDIGRRHAFNTAIAAVMKLLKDLARLPASLPNAAALTQEALETAVLLLAPIVPHIADALWRALGHDEAVIDASWPEADADALLQEHVEWAVQVNGRLRGRIQLPVAASDVRVREAALADDNVRRFTTAGEIDRTVIVPGRLINIVLRDGAGR
ncbi:MAG: leucine--tRNA ligase [Gammaproteobacteria bacterium]|nr:leucine--tRNA ligase [Gammaproteobacteria bacterium]